MRVDVILITYNHEKFIRDALESIIMQKTDFNFDIIVADDNSTDQTVSIIKEYEKKCNIPFQYLHGEKRLGTTKNYLRAFDACHADFIAPLEGDDFWTTPDRLQNHVDFLDHHYEAAMSLNAYHLMNFETAEYTYPRLHGLLDNGWTLYTSQQIILNSGITGNFSATFFRTKFVKQLPREMFEGISYEFITSIIMGLRGYIGYLYPASTVYRAHNSSVYSSKSREHNTRELLSMLESYKKWTKHKYDDEFNELQKNLKKSLAKLSQTENGSFSPSLFVRLKIKNTLRLVYKLMPPAMVWLVKNLIPRPLWDRLKKM